MWDLHFISQIKIKWNFGSSSKKNSQRFDSPVVKDFFSYNNAVKFYKIKDVVCWKLINLLQVFMQLTWSCLEGVFDVN